METLHRIALAISAGHMECGIAMGIERMGRGLGREGPKPTRITAPNPRLTELNEVQIAPARDHEAYFSVPFPEYIRKSPWLQSMVQTAQNVAETYDLSRQELDAYSAESHAKTYAAYENGLYKDEIVPLEVEEPVCGGCGVQLHAGAKFCAECGHKVGA